MKTHHAILLLLLIPAVAKATEPATPRPRAKIEEAVLAAARAGDASGIMRVILQSYEQRGSFDETAAKELLDGLARGGELPAFTILLSELRKTNTGKDWQPDDALLDELIRDGREDFIDAMLASWLDPARLEAKGGAGDAEMSQWLARRTAGVRKQRGEHEELVAAAGKGDIETMRRLLDAGVDVNCVAEKSRHTPLTLAARESRLEAVRLLLERGAKVDQPKHPGWDYTPLCLTKSVAIAALLKAHGANVHAKLFKRDVSILTYIVRWGGADMVEWMLNQGLDPTMIGDNKQNLLFDAGDARTAELLLAAGVDPNQVDEFGRTPLAGAQSGGIAKLLMAAGAKPKADETAIAEMIYRFASASAIEEVIKAAGQLDPAVAQKGLIAAAHGDQPEIVELLLAHGAKANEPGMWGKNDPTLPLMVCTIFGSEKTAKVLLAHGADPNAGERSGLMLENAMDNGHIEVAKLLRVAGAKGVPDLAFAVAIKDGPTVNALLTNPPAFAQHPEFWKGALPAAARTGRVEAVRAAIKHGVPLVDSDANAFAAAAGEGQHEALAELLTHRKEPHDSAQLRQALWNAVWNSHPYERQRLAEDFEKCVKLLLEAGAFTPADAGHRSIVATAVFTRNPGGNPKVVEMLVAAGAEANPRFEQGKPQRLSDAVQAACTQQGCSTPFARTIAALEKAAHLVIKR